MYETGRATIKKHRFHPEIIRKYFRVVDMMISRPEVLALMKYNSLNDKKLIGDKVGLSSVRGNTHYRIEFEETIIENQTVATLSHITELSNQYQ